MKTFLSFSTACILIAFTSCQVGNDSDKLDSVSALLEQITNPPAEYRTAPLWDWNDVINKEDIKYHMEKFQEGGLGGVFIHPRPGLVTEYLSDEWNELFKYTIDVGKNLGLFVWIYDENSYPSGFAGGHVQDRFPESYNQGSGLGYKVSQDLSSDTIGLDVVQVLQSYPDMEYYIFYKTYPKESWWYGGFPYVDLLYPGVTDTFMRATMEGYEEYFGDEFGKTVPGVFTDEPNLPAAKGPGTAIRWTPDLFEQFEKRWGYKLEENLISLVKEHGPWKKVRHNYHELMLELFLDRWAVPWYEYCEEKNMIWTGHYWEHGWPIPGEGYDEAAFYMYHQMPGIDMLGRQLCENGMCQQFGNIRAVRELASAANQAGAKRRFSETYGGAGWQVSFTDLKRLLDWECVLGVNFVNQHLSYFSMQGVRKFDYPPSFSYQEPWWDQHKLLGDYTARISLALSSGEQINKVLVLQPNTTAWMFHADANPQTEVNDLSVEFKKFLMELESDQLEYDLGSEQVIKRFGSLEPAPSEAGGTRDSDPERSRRARLVIGERSYERIILPPGIRNLDSNTKEVLDQFVEAGGDLLVLSDSIDHLDGSPQDAKLFEQSDETNLGEWFGQDDCILKTISGSPELVFHQRRVLEDGELIFIVNSDKENPAELELQWIGKRMAEIDLISGEISPVEYERTGRMLSASIILEPVGSILLISGKKLSNQKGPGQFSETAIASASDLAISRLTSNVLTIDYLDVETKDYQQEDVFFMDAMYKLFEWSELETGNPWQHKIQFRKTYLEMDEFDESTWHKMKYHFEIDGSLSIDQMHSLRLVAERPDIWKVHINGLEIHAVPGEWWLDKNFPVYNIGGSVHPGMNTITLKAEKMSVFAEIMPVYVLGDFSLTKKEKGFTLTAPQELNKGSWIDYGLPFYGDKIKYSQSFNIKDLDKKIESFILMFPNWNGTCGEVLVNGETAGIIGWQDELDISGYIKEGTNDISFIITGSLKNTLGPLHRPLVGWIDGPFSWNDSPDNQPPGEDYFFMDYGMVGALRLVRRSGD